MGVQHEAMLRLEIAHVLFMDVVGYSKLLINQQSELLRQLNEIEQPENFYLIGDLALTNIALGDKAAALTLAERAMTTTPLEKDAIDGAVPIDILARVAAQTGEPDRAIAALEKLPYSGISQPPLTSALLRFDPMFDPLRNDPRFQKLAADFAPKDGKK